MRKKDPKYSHAMRNTSFRSRTFAPKHMGACRTCRLRHVRCDQRRPRCTPCTTSSRICEPAISSLDEQANQLKVVTWEPKKKSPPRSLQATRSQSPESRACQYFQEVVVSKLVETFDSPFWTNTVPKTMAASTPLRHAVIALSSLWESGFDQLPVNSFVSEKGGSYALRQYGKALTETQKALMSPQKLSFEELLVGGILFLCFEMFQGHVHSSLSQVSNLFRVFCEWQDCSNKKPSFRLELDPEMRDSVQSQLLCIRSRLLIQSLLFPDTHMIDTKLLQPMYCLEAPDIPHSFNTLTEARDYFCASTSSMIHASLSQAFQGGLIDARQSSTQRPLFTFRVDILHRWFNAFQRFESQIDLDEKPCQKVGIFMLKMHYLTMTGLMKSLAFQTESGFDVFTSEFEAMLEFASFVLSQKNTKKLSKHLPEFEMGMLAPLYMVATRCRDPHLRRKAVAMLRDGPQREGLWEGAMLARLAEHIIMTEEKSCEAVTCAEDVPESSRVRIQNVFVRSLKRQMEVYLVHGAKQSGVSQTLQETIYY